MKFKCRRCGWVGYEEELELEYIHYYEEDQFVEETYPYKCPICHNSDEVYCTVNRYK